MNTKMTIGYKIPIVLGLFITFFGAGCLILHYRISSPEVWRTVGVISLFVGFCAMFLTEVITAIISNSLPAADESFLAMSIRFGGFTAIVYATILFCIFSLLPPIEILEFHLWSAIGAVLFYEVIMLYKKYKLRQSGVAIGKGFSIVAVVISVLTVIALITTKTVVENLEAEKTKNVAQMLFYMSYGASVETVKMRIYTFVSAGLLLTAMLLMLYVELLFKVRCKKVTES